MDVCAFQQTERHTASHPTDEHPQYPPSVKSIQSATLTACCTRRLCCGWSLWKENRSQSQNPTNIINYQLFQRIIDYFNFVFFLILLCSSFPHWPSDFAVWCWLPLSLLWPCSVLCWGRRRNATYLYEIIHFQFRWLYQNDFQNEKLNYIINTTRCGRDATT